MISFVLRRLGAAVPTMLVIIALTFFMMRAAPGGPFEAERELPPEIEANLQARFGLDKPLLQQFLNYLSGVLRGDFGPSYKYSGKDVSDFIAEGFPISATVGLSALLVGVVIGVAVGLAAALRANRPLDRGVMLFAVLGVCIPTFVTAPLFILLFGSVLGWLPSGGVSGGWRSLVLPVVVLALPQIALIARLVRSSMIEVLQANYIRTARARGLPEHAVLRRHALRGAIIPVVAYLGPACAGLITGSLVVEKLFSLPGLGRSFVIGALQRDYTVVMGVVIFYAALVILLNILSDVAVALLDPRVRL